MFLNTQNFYSKLLIKHLKASLIANASYMYIADGLSNVIDGENVSNTNVEHNKTLNQVLVGKKIAPSDIYPMVRRIDWSSRVYDCYDDSVDLLNKDFFVINSSGSVYKCIFNNDGGVSTVEPTTLDTIPTTTADGYVWKLMFTLSQAELNDFCTNELVIVKRDTDIINAAIPGTIDYFKIKTSGQNYLHHDGIVVDVVDNSTFQINSQAHPTAGSYNGSSFYISSGPGVGQIAVINNYFSNSIGKFVKTSTSLTGVTSSSHYSIAPSLVITGDGEDAKGRTLVNNGVLVGTEVINQGSDYSYADVTVSANTNWGSGGTISSVISPIHGHSSDPETELYSRFATITSTFSSDEINTIPTEIKFSRYGLIGGDLKASNSAPYTDDTFNNTLTIGYTPVSSTFVIGDVIKSDPSSNNAKATVMFANTSVLIAKYDNKDKFGSTPFTVFTDSGKQGSATSITQPNVDIHNSELYTINTVNTIQRNVDDKETISIIVSV